MNFFGIWKVRDFPAELGNPKAKNLWILDNPVGPDMFGYWTDSGMPVIVPDRFVFDMSSSGMARGMWPNHWGRKSATGHDFGYGAHKKTAEELMTELKAWFDFMAWPMDQRIHYVNWLRMRGRLAWDLDFYRGTAFEGINPALRWIAFKLLCAFGWLAWNTPSGNRTRQYRLTGRLGSVQNENKKERK